jgi:hypothetical protein
LRACATMIASASERARVFGGTSTFDFQPSYTNNTGPSYRAAQISLCRSSGWPPLAMKKPGWWLRPSGPDVLLKRGTQGNTCAKRWLSLSMRRIPLSVTPALWPLCGGGSPVPVATLSADTSGEGASKQETPSCLRSTLTGVRSKIGGGVGSAS